jgi:D-sedoheptulose 7-phosphate isomerase
MLDLREAHSQSVAAAYLVELTSVLARVPHEPLARTVDVLLEARAGGRRVYVIGNGGSAATASHLVCDLIKAAHVPPYRPLRAFALGDNTAILTAWANDSAYEHTFAEQIEAHVEPGDVVIAISASGNSPNILNGLAAASRNGARTIALLGFDGGAARALADIALHVPCDGYGLSEDAHSAICHALTAGIRHALELGSGA